VTDTAVPITTKKDWTTDQEVRWCPGCGDYSILTAVQMLLPELGVRRENTVFVSGIGCSSRFPYYMSTYGIHSIHGRAPAIATGIAAARPDLDVWVVTGDGDALSIGGNHLIHALRRNVNLTILLFNNQIYGLTKGQYSPTSEVGKVTKSTPMGSVDHPFNPVSLALGAEATFVARTHDLDRKHMMETIRRAHAHRGASFVEIYQNCNVFNDGAFDQILGKEVRPNMLIPLAAGPRRGTRVGGPGVPALASGVGAARADADRRVPRRRAPHLRIDDAGPAHRRPGALRPRRSGQAPRLGRHLGGLTPGAGPTVVNSVSAGVEIAQRWSPARQPSVRSTSFHVLPRGIAGECDLRAPTSARRYRLPCRPAPSLKRDAPAAVSPLAIDARP
jgi:pyruvate/2-oxoacid:ferredoxin oxidoreductase beta subunit